MVAFLRFGCLAFAAACIFSGSCRMGRKKNRNRKPDALNRPELRSASSSLARQPIMGMNNIGGVQRLLHTSLRELIRNLSQFILGKATSCGKVNAVANNTRTALGRLTEGRISWKRLTAIQSENLNPQLRIQLQHGMHRTSNIDVHAAGIPATGLREGVGVHRVHVNRSDCLGVTHRRFPLYSTVQRPTRLVYRDRTFARREV